jgi:DNA invertase Pin-like site-specific DNA recombinase
MNKAVIYARVSSTGDRQSTERQVADLTRYAAAAGLDVVAIYEEKASGAKKDREQLAACVEFLKGGGAGTLLVTELSRLGRSLRQVLELVEDLTSSGVNIFFQSQGLNTIVDGKPDATVKAMVSMFGAFAELERSMIVDRLQSGRRVALENGKFKPGRPDGSRMSDEELLAKYPKAVKRLQAGRTIREVAGECGLSSKTVQKIKNALK